MRGQAVLRQTHLCGDLALRPCARHCCPAAEDRLRQRQALCSAYVGLVGMHLGAVRVSTRVQTAGVADVRMQARACVHPHLDPVTRARTHRRCMLVVSVHAQCASAPVPARMQTPRGHCHERTAGPRYTASSGYPLPTCGLLQHAKPPLSSTYHRISHCLRNRDRRQSWEWRAGHTGSGRAPSCRTEAGLGGMLPGAHMALVPQWASEGVPRPTAQQKRNTTKGFPHSGRGWAQCPEAERGRARCSTVRAATLAPRTTLARACR